MIKCIAIRRIYHLDEMLIVKWNRSIENTLFILMICQIGKRQKKKETTLWMDRQYSSITSNSAVIDVRSSTVFNLPKEIE